MGPSSSSAPSSSPLPFLSFSFSVYCAITYKPNSYPLEVCNNMTFNKCTGPCHQHPSPVLDHFHHSSKFSHDQVQRTSLLPPPPAITHLLSVSEDLPFLDVSYTWNYTIGSLMIWLLSLSVFLPFNHVVACVNMGLLFMT